MVSIPITNDDNFEFLLEGFYLFIAVSENNDDRDLIRSVSSRNVTLLNIIDDDGEFNSSSTKLDKLATTVEFPYKGCHRWRYFLVWSCGV